MDFCRILLGFQEIEDLIKLAIKEKYITSYCKDYEDFFDLKRIEKDNDWFFIKNNKINDKSLLLRIIMLYDNIDSNRLMPFDISQLIDKGLFSENSTINKISMSDRHIENIINKSLDKMEMNFDFNYTNFIKLLFIDVDNAYHISSFSSIDDKDAYDFSKTIENGDIEKYIQLLNKFKIYEIIKEELINLQDYDIKFFYDKFHKNELEKKEIRKQSKKIVQKYFISPVKELILRQKYNEANEYKINRCIHLINDNFIINNKYICSSCPHKNYFHAIHCDNCEYFSNKFVTLSDLFTSLEFNIPIYSSYIKSSSLLLIDSTKIIDDVYKLIKKSEVAKFMKINLKQLNCLPEPKNLEEAIYYRNQPEIISFRDIFKTWCESLQYMNDEITIKKITKDFNEASEFIDNQYKKNRSIQKPINLFLNIVIDFINGINGISHLTFPYTIKKRFDERSEAKEKQKNEWFILTR